MTQQCPFSAAEYGAEAQSLPRDRGMSNRVDLTEDGVQAPGSNHLIDGVSAVSQISELHQRDHPVLLSRSSCQSMVTSSFVVHIHV